MWNQKILEEKLDPNYEPTWQEVKEYAEWLGMDLEGEQDLIWIARQGLTAKLPSEWKPCQNELGQLYYFNFDTGESVWEHPCDTVSKQLYNKGKMQQVQQEHAAHCNSLSSLMDPLEQQHPGIEQRHLATNEAHPAVEKDGSTQVPPGLTGREYPFTELGPSPGERQQATNALDNLVSDAQGRQGEQDADFPVRLHTPPVDESTGILDHGKQQENVNVTVQQAGSAHQIEHVQAQHLDHECQASYFTDPKALEIALEKALSIIKAELEVKQTTALLDLQRSFERKCVEIQQQHCSELQSLKAQLTAALTHKPVCTAACDRVASAETRTGHADMEVLHKPAGISWPRWKPEKGQNEPPILWGGLLINKSDAATVALPTQDGASHGKSGQESPVAVVQPACSQHGLIVGCNVPVDSDTAPPSTQEPPNMQRARSQHSCPTLVRMADSCRSVHAETASRGHSDAVAGAAAQNCTAPFPGVPEVSPDPAERMVRTKAFGFFREQKRMLRRRQLAMHKAREEWHHNAEMLARVEPSPARNEMVTMLKQVHHTLETQAKRLNDDALQLAVAKNCIEDVNMNGDSAESAFTRPVVDPPKIAQLRHSWGNISEFHPYRWHNRHYICSASTSPGLRRRNEGHGRSLSIRDLSNHAEAEHTLHRHAKWLRSLREQIVKVSHRVQTIKHPATTAIDVRKPPATRKVYSDALSS